MSPTPPQAFSFRWTMPLKTNPCHHHWRGVWVDVYSIAMVCGDTPQRTLSTAVILLWLPDVGGLSLPAAGHTPLLLMVGDGVCKCVCPRGYAWCRRKWLNQCPPPQHFRVHVAINAPWVGSHPRRGGHNKSLAPFPLCWFLSHMPRTSPKNVGQGANGWSHPNKRLQNETA